MSIDHSGKRVVAAAAFLFPVLWLSGAALAQAVPSALGQEILAKTTLMTFNDANITGNYNVLHAKLSKPFRDQFSPDKLKETFKEFAEKHIEIDAIVAQALVPSTETAIDGDGVMRMMGAFDTKPKNVKYRLSFIRSDGEWKPLGINVTID
ncbi:MAG: hypothetical protein K2P80_02745 [Beijerinckiaceae bacterium]|nr:hypothetical protein [Beijerinckiaceae bacterium]